MDTDTRHEAVDYDKPGVAISVFIIAICCVVLVCWLALSQQDAKLYVCVSQPLAVQCFERKPR